MLPIILAAAASVPPLNYPLPPCSVNGVGVVRTKQELPPSVRKTVEAFADSTEPFNKTDAPPPGMEDLPFKRFVCGYPTPSGYIVEWELGGRGYSIETTVFRRTTEGFELDPAYRRRL